jgi:hypothetical protein
VLYCTVLYCTCCLCALVASSWTAAAFFLHAPGPADTNTCAQLLVCAEDRRPDAIPHLAALPGIQSIPQEVFYGLLWANTKLPDRREDSSLPQLLQLPHAQHITGSQLSQLLVECLDPSLDFDGRGVQALLT